MKGLKKALGQNFFNNPNLADKIVNIVLSNKTNSVIEIGPGDGYFTKRLADRVNNLVLIEKDTVLAQQLSVKFPKANIINQDFFEVNITKLIIADDTVAFGSLPYNVSKHIISTLLEQTTIKHFFFIVQKEVAMKYCNTQQTSIQYLTSKLFVDSKLLLNINPGSFIPAPKVDSSFISMQRNNNSKDIEVKKFITFVKTAFRSPRKTLKNNLKGLNVDLQSEILLKRPSQLTFNEYVTLFESLK